MRTSTGAGRKGHQTQDRWGKKLQREVSSQEAMAWGLQGYESGRIIPLGACKSAQQNGLVSREQADGEREQ